MTTKHRVVSLGVGLVAVVTFVGAVLVFLGDWPPLSSAGRHRTAVGLMFLWALGPAAWFLFESRRWKDQPDLYRIQQYARDFWIGAGAIVLLLTAREISMPAAGSSVRNTVPWALVVEVIKATIWPIVVAIGLVMFRESIDAFFSALGTRASKIGAFNISIEFASLPEARPWSSVVLDDLKSEYPAAAGDSADALFGAVADTAHADYVIVNLENGEAWLTSRLFILAALVPRVRPIKRMVFLSGSTSRFVGESTPEAACQRLADRYPWLEEAYIAAHVNVDPTYSPKLRATLAGKLMPGAAGDVLSHYLSAIRDPAGSGPEWVRFTNYVEHATWVTPALVEDLLGKRLNTSAVERDPSVQDTVIARTLLRHYADYVAIIDSEDRFLNLVDRRKAIDRVVRRELA
jgi:hypothetical protein